MPLPVPTPVDRTTLTKPPGHPAMFPSSGHPTLYNPAIYSTQAQPDAFIGPTQPSAYPLRTKRSAYIDPALSLLRPPYSAPTGHIDLPPTSYGPPLRFLIGPNDFIFDVHRNFLADPRFSFVFDPRPPIARIDASVLTHPIRLPDVSVEDFSILCTWLYSQGHQKPQYNEASDLRGLCQLWIAASKLGLWFWMNTLLRLGMALMQPRGFEVDVETVRFVYENTPVGSKLRSYIIALFCQRGRVALEHLDTEGYGAEIRRDASEFLTLFVRSPPAPDLVTLKRWGKEEGVRHAYRWERDARGFPVFVESKTGLNAKVWKKVAEEVPDYLVWDHRQRKDLPDEAHFVTAEEGLIMAAGVLKQLVKRKAMGAD